MNGLLVVGYLTLSTPHIGLDLLVDKSKNLYAKARGIIPSGVNSPVRYYSPYPFFASKSKGGLIWDVDGKRYVDLCCAYGALLLGHRRPEILKAVSEQMKSGTLFCTPTELEVDLCSKIRDLYPSMTRTRLVNTGGEATMTAIRLARGYTKNKKIIKFEGCYHGGKDSTYAAYLAKQSGHDLQCLVTANPYSAESKLLHHPNIRLTSLQAKSMGLEHLTVDTDSENELDSLASLLKKAVSKYDIKGVVHGGIASIFQQKQFEAACKSANLTPIGPIWGREPMQYMQSLLDCDFSFVITAVSSGGLDESWLGCKIDTESLKRLSALSVKHGFNLNFEGGEAETLVLDCPLFSRQILIEKSKSVWDGYRGIFEIEAASLGEHARWSKDKPAGSH